MRFLAALLVSLLVLAATPASSNTHNAMQAAAQHVGADVDVLYAQADNLNAGFVPAGTYCIWMFCQVVERHTVIFFGDWSTVPYEVRLAVLLHELGHYRQAIEGRPFDEWDADLYSANTLCRLGHDGVSLYRQVATTFLKNYGRSWGDGHGGDHGSWYERVENVRLKSTCRQESSAP